MVPSGAIRHINRGSFVQNEQTDLLTGEAITTYQAKSGHLPIGVSQIKHKEGGDYILTISAKTLNDNYLDGINLNNWDEAISGAGPILDIDPQKLWDADPKILRCDTTDNINIEDIGHSKSHICRSLLENKMNARFIHKWYQSKNKLGIEFAGTQQEKNRIICYDKTLDLMKSANKEFMKSLNNPLKVINEAQKTLRFETNHTSFKSIRDRFDISDNTLSQMLNSKSPVNYNFLTKVMQSDFQMNLFTEINNMDIDPKEYVYRKGLENIIKELGYDETRAKEFFKLLFKENFKYQYYRGKNPIKNIIRQIKSERANPDTQKVNMVCKMIMEKLKIAV